MNEEPTKTSATLLCKAKQNNTGAWERLVDLYSRPVYRWCRKAGLQSADAGNVVQEVLRSVARKLPDFQHENPTSSFRGWLRRITTNKINDHFRSQAKLPSRPRGGTDAHRHLLHVPAPEAHEVTWATTPRSSSDRFTQLDDKTIEEVRSQFSDRDWRMFWRVVVDGQSAVEVGAEFDVTANTVRIVKTRLLRKLRAQFQAKEPPDAVT